MLFRSGCGRVAIGCERVAVARGRVAIGRGMVIIEYFRVYHRNWRVFEENFRISPDLKGKGFRNFSGVLRVNRDILGKIIHFLLGMSLPLTKDVLSLPPQTGLKISKNGSR